MFSVDQAVCIANVERLDIFYGNDGQPSTKVSYGVFTILVGQGNFRS